MRRDLSLVLPLALLGAIGTGVAKVAAGQAARNQLPESAETILLKATVRADSVRGP